MNARKIVPVSAVTILMMAIVAFFAFRAGRHTMELAERAWTPYPTYTPQPTYTPYPTYTPVPTATPTEVPTPTATPAPSVWDIAHTMLKECKGGVDSYESMAKSPYFALHSDGSTYFGSDVLYWYMSEAFARQKKGSTTLPNLNDFPKTSEPDPNTYHRATYYGLPAAADKYVFEMMSRIVSQHPEFLQVNSEGVALWRSVSGGVGTLLNDGINPNPWSYLDYATALLLQRNYDQRMCPVAILFTETSPDENGDGDGILAGEAYLFYEVGGTKPYVLDGELKEVHFAFPPAP